MKFLTHLFILTLSATPVIAAEPPSINLDDSLMVPGYRLPLPPGLSPEARDMLQSMIRGNVQNAAKPAIPDTPQTSDDVARINQDILKGAPPTIAKLTARYPVHIRTLQIDGINHGQGIHGMEITPKDGVKPGNSNKVLIELHPGGFKYGSAADMGVEEAIPVAALTGYRVIALGYRQGPVHHFPAASEDVAALYRYLLKTYDAKNIGIFGGSAGGLLTAQALAWFDHVGLPMPGAIGIFFASADARWDGDSIWTVPGTLGGMPPASQAVRKFDEASYYGETSMDDPLMSPIQNPTVLAKFPPTLVISATRADDMGSAVRTHRALTDLGVRTDLQIWDGLWHCFYVGTPDLAESRAAYRVIAGFFQRELAAKP